VPDGIALKPDPLYHPIVGGEFTQGAGRRGRGGRGGCVQAERHERCWRLEQREPAPLDNPEGPA